MTNGKVTPEMIDEEWPLPPLEWRRLDDYCLEWNGYRVSLARHNQKELWCAFTPALPGAALEKKMRVRYELGMPVPQPRDWLGCFLEPALAKQACVDHYRRNAG